MQHQSSTLDLASVTTVPMLPLTHPSFWDEVLSDLPQTAPRAPESVFQTPVWVELCIVFGALLMVGSGTFLLCVGLGV